MTDQKNTTENSDCIQQHGDLLVPCDREDYYFRFIPDFEKNNSYFDLKTYGVLFSTILTYSAMETRTSQFLARWDLFPSAFNLLAILYRTSNCGMPLSKLSNLLAVSRANVTGLVDCLESRKLVERTSDPNDRRVRLAVLTSEGSELIQEIMPLYYARQKGLADCLTDQEQECMVHALTKFRRTLLAAEEGQ